MDWIDETVAIGSWIDARCVRILKREKIDLIIDSRTLFSKKSGMGSNEPDLDGVYRIVRLMMELAKLNAKVLVFCRHGKDRSPFLVTVYFSKKYGVPCEEAYRLIMSKRSRTVYHPEWVQMLGSYKKEG
ncbi:MAG: dual specificity protein phosphatase family protein [Methanomassiliicoccales archaeon]|nr:dual specificity protein phosphatase family protein [Methanomassiliicoccales archaeon]